MITDEDILKRQLAKLLSFDIEDVVDVFDPLLDFDSEEDLLEYICALLGDETDELVEFVKNIIRFQNNQSIIYPSVDDDVETSKVEQLPTKEESVTPHKPSSSSQSSEAKIKEQEERKRQKKIREDNIKKQKQTEEQKLIEKQELNRNAMEKEDREKRLKQQYKAEERALKEFKRKHEEEKRRELELACAMGKTHISGEETKTTSRNVAKKREPSKPRPPLKGKAKIVCGCFGTVCKPLTNCLHCGRILCKKEGYGYCPFCGNLIEKVTGGAESGKGLDKATLHKERLLKFDRENTKRTQIYDDQADYFQNSTSTWLTADEQQDAMVQEEKRKIDLHTIKKHTLNIQF